MEDNAYYLNICTTNENLCSISRPILSASHLLKSWGLNNKYCLMVSLEDMYLRIVMPLPFPLVVVGISRS